MNTQHRPADTLHHPDCGSPAGESVKRQRSFRHGPFHLRRARCSPQSLAHTLWGKAFTYIVLVGLVCGRRGRSVPRDGRGTPGPRGGHTPGHRGHGESPTRHRGSSGRLGTSSRQRGRDGTPSAPAGSKKEWSLWRVQRGNTCMCCPILKALTFLLLFKASRFWQHYFKPSSAFYTWSSCCLY